MMRCSNDDNDHIYDIICKEYLDNGGIDQFIIDHVKYMMDIAKSGLEYVLINNYL